MFDYIPGHCSNFVPRATSNVIVQASLQIGAVNDPLELEADHIADQVMRMPQESVIQRKCSDCEKEEVQRQPLANFIQKKGNSGKTAAPNSVAHQINSTRGGGTKMPASTKSFMENRFGTDFSNVNIHTDPRAVEMSEQIQAKAFTVGNDIYFNSGMFSPETLEGKYLLAHELTHTIQQKNQSQIQRQPAVDLRPTPRPSAPTRPHPPLRVIEGGLSRHLAKQQGERQQEPDGDISGGQ